MTPAELREAARRQNEEDHAAGKLPSRYVEDPGVLAQVARLLLAGEPPGVADGDPATGHAGSPSSSKPRRSVLRRRAGDAS